MSVPPEAASKARGGRLVRTPTVLQMEMVECGAASLRIILAYHGRSMPLEELRVRCGVSRDGTNATNIVKAARLLGLSAKGYRKSPETLKAMTFPVIIHWNFNHFLVLEGFRKGRAYLSDPAQGRYSVPEAELDEAFTGVVLAFTPGPEFVAGNERRGLLASLLPRLRGSYRALAYVALTSLALVAPGLVVPSFIRVFIDQVLVRGLYDSVPGLVAAMCGTAALLGVLTWLERRFLLRLQTKLALASSGRFLWHVLQLPVEFFTQRYAGDIAGRVAINDQVAHLLTGELATAGLDAVMILFYLALMLSYDVTLTVVAVLASSFSVAAVMVTTRLRRDGTRLLQQEAGKLGGMTMGGLNMIETLKAAGAEADFFQAFAGHLAKAANAEQRLGLVVTRYGAIPTLLLTLNGAVILGLGASRVMDGVLTIGSLMAFKYLADSFTSPLMSLVRLGDRVQMMEAGLTRLDDVLRHRRAPHLAISAGAADEEVVTRLSGDIEVRDITFGYSPMAPPLIESFSLRCAPGSRVALVGGSGSGKSTAARLICGLYEPWSGEIRFDGQLRSEVAPTSLTASLALVDQDILVFSDTVRANLSLWDTTISEAEIVRAAKDACIHEDIAARRGGYESMVDEGGRNFSGGQRQRLEIARALAQNPSILVLDEGTSALDAATERTVMSNIRRRGCTCVVVAHRLSTIRDADEIIVLERGRVVERGRHEALAAAGGIYANLIRTM